MLGFGLEIGGAGAGGGGGGAGAAPGSSSKAVLELSVFIPDLIIFSFKDGCVTVILTGVWSLGGGTAGGFGIIVSA